VSVYLNKSLASHVRRGFTAIEMMVVVSIVILLVAMVVPTIGPAIKKGQVNDAANAIQRACSMARQLARNNSEPRGGSPKYFGVAIVVPTEAESNKPAYAVVVYHNGPLTNFGAANNIAFQYPNGTPDLSRPLAGSSTGFETYSGYKPAGKYVFNKGVLPFQDDNFLPSAPSYTLMGPGTSVGWYYQYRTGFIFTNVSNPYAAVDVGTSGASPRSLGVATIDLKYKAAIAIYKIGLMNVQDMK
jgi:type II secretory pathway pseudopilin PulG